MQSWQKLMAAAVLRAGRWEWGAPGGYSLQHYQTGGDTQHSDSAGYIAVGGSIPQSETHQILTISSTLSY